MAGTANIKRLTEDVINKIAAGEVVRRPMSAVKEMVENSIDAGATLINVSVKEGGLKTIQIQDNGCGIHKEDLDIVCERFTTSKLRAFEDLQSITTYGFRGEALASLSHVATVTIVTRTAGTGCAFKAEYLDGKLRAPVAACAGTHGTTITISDLFYNIPIRRKAFKCASEEHAKIVDVVCKYAIHNSKIGFSVKRIGENGVDIRTLQGSTCLQNIAQVYGSALVTESAEFQVADPTYNFTASGVVATSPSLKSLTVILFINNRLVECRSFKKGFEHLNKTQLPKTCCLFVYISISIDPQNIDVNVHPSKEEVKFLHETEIFEKILLVVESKVHDLSSSRSFPLVRPVQETQQAFAVKFSTSEPSSDGGAAKIKDSCLVRTDSREQKLDKFLIGGNSNCVPPVSRMDAQILSRGDDPMDCSEILGPSTSGSINRNPDIPCESRADIKLTSVMSLQQQIVQQSSPTLRQIILGHTFVGNVNPKFALVQHDTNLFLVNTQTLSEALFYQIVIMKFGNLDVLRLSEPWPLKDLVRFSLRKESNSATSAKELEQRASVIVSELMSKAEMLWDYFSLRLNDGKIDSLPNLIPGFIPQLEGLPSFVLAMARDVDWSGEQECFHTVARTIASFYTVKENYCCGENLSAVGDESVTWKSAIEHYIYPEAKKRLLPPGLFESGKTFLKLTDLQQLYKVFERC